MTRSLNVTRILLNKSGSKISEVVLQVVVMIILQYVFQVPFEKQIETMTLENWWEEGMAFGPLSKHNGFSN